MKFSVRINGDLARGLSIVDAAKVALTGERVCVHVQSQKNDRNLQKAVLGECAKAKVKIQTRRRDGGLTVWVLPPVGWKVERRVFVDGEYCPWCLVSDVGSFCAHELSWCEVKCPPGEEHQVEATIRRALMREHNEAKKCVEISAVPGLVRVFPRGARIKRAV